MDKQSSSSDNKSTRVTCSAEETVDEGRWRRHERASECAATAAEAQTSHGEPTFWVQPHAGLARTRPHVHVFEGPACFGDQGKLTVDIVATEPVAFGPKDKIGEARTITPKDKATLSELREGDEQQRLRACLIEKTRQEAQRLLKP